MRTCQRFVWRCVVCCLLVGAAGRFAAAQTATGDAARTAQIEQYLQQAAAHFANKELLESSDLYRRVLLLDPTQPFARQQLYEIAKLYLNKLQDAKQDQSALLQQQYRTLVRDLLQLLTAQLNQALQDYGRLIAAAKQGQDVMPQLAPALERVLGVLRDLANIYENLPQETADAQKMRDRLRQSITKYEQELARYNK